MKYLDRLILRLLFCRNFHMKNEFQRRIQSCFSRDLGDLILNATARHLHKSQLDWLSTDYCPSQFHFASIANEGTRRHPDRVT